MACANLPNRPSNASRTWSNSPHRNPVPTVNSTSYRDRNVTVTICADFERLLSWLFHLHLGHVCERVSFHNGTRLPRYPSPYRYIHRFAVKSSAPQADGMSIGGLAASHPGRGESWLWRVPVTVQSCGSIWYLRRRTRTFLQDRVNPRVSHSTLAGTLVLVPATWVPIPWPWLLEPYLIPNLMHRKGSTED